MEPQVPVLTRLWLCWVCWFRVLFDADFARRALELRNGVEPQAPALPAEPAAPRIAAPVNLTPSTDALDGALQLLALLQREGRFIDFVQQEISGFADGEVGAAARVVHEGCRRALRSHASIVSVRQEAEGARLTLDATGAKEVKLTGNLAGSAPYTGVLRHRGWRVDGLKLPTLVGQQDLRVVAPAEVEL